MSSHYWYQCTKCEWYGRLYRNAKKCPACDAKIERAPYHEIKMTFVMEKHPGEHKWIGRIDGLLKRTGPVYENSQRECWQSLVELLRMES